MKILIGTKNPGKILGAKLAFEKYFESIEIEGIPVASDVGEEPIHDEIYLGAISRVHNLEKYVKEHKMEVDYLLGIESGITNLLGKWVNISIAVIKDKNGILSWGTSSAFPIPDKYIEKIKNTSLGEVMDNIFQEQNLGDGKGGISFLTHHEVSRIDLTKEAFIMALTQFINGDIWKDKED